MLCLFAYLYMRPLIRTNLGSAQRCARRPPRRRTTTRRHAAAAGTSTASATTHPPSRLPNTINTTAPPLSSPPARSGQINYYTLYIGWLCTAVFYHLPSLEALGIDVKADLSLALSVFFSSLAVG